MGRHVFQALAKHPKVTLVHLVDPDPAPLVGMASPKVFCHNSLDSLLGHAPLELAFITSPNHTHKNLALRLMQEGVAVLLEKPIAPTLAESIEVVEASEHLGAYLQIGFEARYCKLYSWVKDWIDSGLLGAVINTHCTYICSEFHGKGSWRNRLITGGSMFGEKLCHYVDLPRWWVGAEISEVYAVSAPNVVPYYEVKDNYHCTYRFENGAVSHLSFAMYLAETFDGDPLENYVTQQMDDGHELRFLITGTKGAAETDVFRRRLRRWEFGDSPKCLTSRLAEEHTWRENDDHRYFHDTTTQAWDVVERVSRGDKPFTAATDSLNTMIVVDAVEQSVEEGCIIRPEYPVLSRIRNAEPVFCARS